MSLMPRKGARVLIVNASAERYFAPFSRLSHSIQSKLDRQTLFLREALQNGSLAGQLITRKARG